MGRRRIDHATGNVIWTMYTSAASASASAAGDDGKQQQKQQEQQQITVEVKGGIRVRGEVVGFVLLLEQ